MLAGKAKGAIKALPTNYTETIAECAPQEITALSVPTVAEKGIGVSYTPTQTTSVPKATEFLVVTLNVAD